MINPLEQPTINNSVVIRVLSSGRALVHTFVGSFSGEAVEDIFADLKNEPLVLPAPSFWQFPVEYDGGDSDVGLDAQGYMLARYSGVQLHWRSEEDAYDLSGLDDFPHEE